LLGKVQSATEFIFYFILQRHVLTGILTRSGKWQLGCSCYYIL